MTNAQKLMLIKKIMGLSHEAFAGLLDVSQRTVFRWKSGESDPYHFTVRCAEQYLNVNQSVEYRNVVEDYEKKSYEQSLIEGGYHA